MKRLLLTIVCIALLAAWPAVSIAQTNLRIASGVVGSLNYALATGIAAVYQTHTGETLEVLTKELTATVPQLYAGQYEIASQVNAAAYIFYNSIDPRTLERTDNKERPAMRLLMLGSASPMGFLAYKSSGMTKASELRGKRVTLRYGHFSVQLMAKANLLAAGLTEEDITVVQASNIPKGAELLNSGTVDACYGAVTVPAFRELDAAKGGVRFLTYEPTPEIRQNVRNFFPGAVFLDANPDPGVVGIPEHMTLLGVNNSLISATNVPDDVIYKFVKTIYENRADLIPYSHDFVAWQDEPPVSTYAAAPFHNGAIRFYKEAGLWTAEMEEWNQKLLDLYPD